MMRKVCTSILFFVDVSTWEKQSGIPRTSTFLLRAVGDVTGLAARRSSVILRDWANCLTSETDSAVWEGQRNVTPEDRENHLGEVLKHHNPLWLQLELPASKRCDLGKILGPGRGVGMVPIVTRRSKVTRSFPAHD